MSSNARIAVTGAGVIAPEVIGIEAFRSLLRQSRSVGGPVTRFDTGSFRSHFAALVEEFDPRRFIPVAKMRRMNQLSRFGVASAMLALEDAGRGEIDPEERGGVAIGTTFGPVETSVKYLDEYREKGPALAPPQLFAESVANAAGSHVAIQHGLRGFNITFTQREGSAMTALSYAAMQIAKGSASMALAGGVDEINEITYGIYDRLGALAREQHGLVELARPFDRDRNGILLGEGGSMFLLEADPGDRAVYGWIAGFAQGRDQSAPLSDWGTDADAVVRVMQRAIDDAAISTDEIDVVFASANGNRKCDALEAKALTKLFGSDPPPIVATKGVFGEYAAGGGLQIAAALLGLRYGELYPSVGFEQPDEGVELPITGALSVRPIRHALVNALSAGGGLISIVLSREGA